MSARDWLDLLIAGFVGGMAAGVLAVALIFGIAAALDAARTRQRRSNHP